MTKKQPNTQRFQLWLHELHQITEHAHKTGDSASLSGEVRDRVRRSFWLDVLEQYIRQEITIARGDRLETLKELLEKLEDAKVVVLGHIRQEPQRPPAELVEKLNGVLEV